MSQRIKQLAGISTISIASPELDKEDLSENISQTSLDRKTRGAASLSQGDTPLPSLTWPTKKDTKKSGVEELDLP